MTFNGNTTPSFLFGGTAMKESTFQRKLKQELKSRFPGCYVLKNDPHYIQGIPDLTVLYKDRWATLEVKKNEAEIRASLENKDDKHPNQAYYVKELNRMSCSHYICPENMEDVLDDLARSFERPTHGRTCAAKS